MLNSSPCVRPVAQDIAEEEQPVIGGAYSSSAYLVEAESGVPARYYRVYFHLILSSLLVCMPVVTFHLVPPSSRPIAIRSLRVVLRRAGNVRKCLRLRGNFLLQRVSHVNARHTRVKPPTEGNRHQHCPTGMVPRTSVRPKR